MKITITKTVTRTYALKNYENYKPSITISEEFDLPHTSLEFYKWKLKDFWEIIDQELQKERMKIDKFVKPS